MRLRKVAPRGSKFEALQNAARLDGCQMLTVGSRQCKCKAICVIFEGSAPQQPLLEIASLLDVIGEHGMAQDARELATCTCDRYPDGKLKSNTDTSQCPLIDHRRLAYE